MPVIQARTPLDIRVSRSEPHAQPKDSRLSSGKRAIASEVRSFLRRPGLLLATLLLAGCLPESQAPKVDGPISENFAAQLQSKIRSSQGGRYTAPHNYQDQEFVATWELGNALQRTSQLQIKPPASWTVDDIVAALQIVLADHETKPWYQQIDATLVRLLREASADKDGRAIGVAPNTPYKIATKVKQHSSQWFVEFKVQIGYADDTSIGF